MSGVVHHSDSRSVGEGVCHLNVNPPDLTGSAVGIGIGIDMHVVVLDSDGDSDPAARTAIGLM